MGKRPGVPVHLPGQHEMIRIHGIVRTLERYDVQTRV